MAFLNLIKELPDHGKRAILMIAQPATIVGEMTQEDKVLGKSFATFGWTLAFSLCLIGFYSLVFGHNMFESVIRAAGMHYPKVESEPDELVKAPVYRAFGCGLGAGVGISMTNRPEVSQTIAFDMGACSLIVDHAKPADLSTKVAETLMLSIYAIAATCCVWLAARLVGTRPAIKMVLAFLLIWSGSVWLAATATISLLVIVTAELLHLSRKPFIVTYSAFIIILFLLFIRAYWNGLRTLIGVPRWKFIIILILAWIASWFVAPIALPLVFLTLKAMPLLENIL